MEVYLVLITSTQKKRIWNLKGNGQRRLFQRHTALHQLQDHVNYVIKHGCKKKTRKMITSNRTK